MNNRFVEIDRYQPRVPSGPRRRFATAQSRTWARAFTAQDRVLVILIENGGTDLGVPALADKLLSVVPSALVPESLRAQLITFLGDTITRLTDNLIESAELAANRYTAAKPGLFGDVIVLRDGTSSYQELKRTLQGLSRDGKIVDLFILTHGRDDTISASGEFGSQKILEMKTEHGKALSLRSVYMMNCVGSSLNQAWLNAGAKVSSGSIRNNYLPEPTMFFFWSAWQAGQTFESAVTSAYRKTINLMNDAVRGFVTALPFPGSGMLAGYLDFEALDFVKDSAPVIQGQRTVTVTSDDLTFAQSTASTASSLATTVLPISLLRSFAQSAAPAAIPPAMPAGRASVSPPGLDLIGRFEPAGTSRETIAQKARDAQAVIHECVQVPLAQNQNDALASFVASIGAAAFRRSTLLKVLNTGNEAAAVAELGKWTKAKQNGALVDVPAVVSRRAAETEMFRRIPAMAQSLSHRYVTHSYRFHSPRPTARGLSLYSLAQNPAAAVLAIGAADAAQIGLAGAAIVQAQISASQGSFTLTYPGVQRMLTNEARTAMPGAQAKKSDYSHKLLYLGISGVNMASADVIIEWQGNRYGEIATPVIRKAGATSTEWSKSSANITISRIERLPEPESDARTWPLVFTYEGTYDPVGNGHFEFSGEFEVNAFGGLKFNRHEVFSRALIEWAIAGRPEDYVQKSADVIVPIPTIPEDQMNYLRTKLP